MKLPLHTTRLLEEREATHGPWPQQALLARQFHQLAASAPRADAMNAQQREAIDMILTKVSRILCGDPSHVDHWNDIAGYALLARDNGPMGLSL